MQYKNVYQFKIFYIDELGNKNYFYIYSDKADVYLLEDLPDTTYYIEPFYLANKDESAPYKGHKEPYLVGTPIALDELKQEIKNTNISSDRSYLQEISVAYHNITEGSSYNIFRKRGKLICLDGLYYPGKLAGEIKDGKIVKQSMQTKQPKKSKYDNDNYTDLE